MKQVRVFDSFASLVGCYPALALPDEAGIADFFLGLPWFDVLFDSALRQDSILRLYALEDPAPRNAEAQVLALCSKRRTGLFSSRTLRALANFYSPVFEFVSTDPGEGRAPEWGALANTIANERPRWDAVYLQPMSRESAGYEQAVAAFRDAGMAVQPFFCFGNWYLDVQGRSYDTYFADLPSVLQSTVQRKSKTLIRDGRLRIDIVQNRDGLDEAITAYQQVYAASWKNAEPYPEFIPRLIRLCAQHGWLRLGIAYIDSRPAAAQLWIVCGKIASIYKLAYDEQFERLSVGSILTAHLMRHAIDVDQVAQVDFLAGDERYKRDWMSARRERWGIVAFNLRTARGLAQAALHLSKRAIKNLHAPRS